MRHHGRFVDMRVIHERMLRTDLRFQAEARATAAKRQPPVVVEVAIVPVSINIDGPVVEVALEPTAAELFGEPVPGEAVQSRELLDLYDGYTPRGRFMRRLDGRWMRLGGLQGAPKGQSDDDV
jgi:hypothetical protein